MSTEFIMMGYDPNLDSGSLWYPVGKNIPAVIKFAKHSAKTFLTILKSDTEQVCIWCRGSSGSITAAMFAMELGELAPTLMSKINYVRKEAELDDSHIGNSYLWKNTYQAGYKTMHIIIDDFIQTGATLNAIYKCMCDEQASTIDCLILSRAKKNLISYLKFKPDYVIHP